jgi:hypothetical protein
MGTTYLCIKHNTKYNQKCYLTVAKNFQNIAAYCFYVKMGYKIDLLYFDNTLLPMSVNLDEYSELDIQNVMIQSNQRLGNTELVCITRDPEQQQELINLNNLLYILYAFKYNKKFNKTVFKQKIIYFLNYFIYMNIYFQLENELNKLFIDLFTLFGIPIESINIVVKNNKINTSEIIVLEFLNEVFKANLDSLILSTKEKYEKQTGGKLKSKKSKKSKTKKIVKH